MKDLATVVAVGITKSVRMTPLHLETIDFTSENAAHRCTSERCGDQDCHCGSSADNDAFQLSMEVAKCSWLRLLASRDTAMS